MLLSLFAVFSFADEPKAEFSLNAGIALPTGSTSDVQKNSFSVDGQALWKVHDIVQVGGELGYMFGSKQEGTIPGNLVGDIDGSGSPSPLAFTSDIDARILHLTPEIKVGPTIDLSGIKLNPFVIGGGGFYWTHYTAGTLTLIGTTSSGISLNGATVAEDSANNYNGGWNVGGGLSVQLPKNCAIGFDVRYHRIMYKGTDDVTFVIPSARLTLLFQ